MSTELIPTTETLQSLVGSRTQKVKIPPYQRSFKWPKESVEELCVDLEEFSDRHPGEKITQQIYFLGSVVGYKDKSDLEIIDGQQRLATLTIWLAVLRDLLREFGLQEADNAARDLHSSMIEVKATGGSFAPRLILSRDDQPFFNRHVQAWERDVKKKPKSASEKLIAGARSVVESFMRRSLDGKAIAEQLKLIERYQDIISAYVKVVLVLSTSEDDATDVFEIMNDRGIGLSTLDLLRNFLIGKAPASDRPQIIDWWSEVFTVGDTAAKQDKFLRHFWISYHADVKKGLYRAAKKELLQAFKDDKMTPKSFTNDLTAASDNYAQLVSGATDSAELNKRMLALKDLKAVANYPPLLACLEEQGVEATEALAAALHSHYVRWTIVGNMESTALEAFVYGLALKIRSSGMTAADAVKEVVTRSIGDEQFEADFRNASLTNQSQRRQIMFEIENYLRKEEGADDLKPDEKIVQVEHVYPQKPRLGQRIEPHDDIVHLIGNLTLLHKRQNAEMNNAPFKDKLPGFKGSDLFLTRSVVSNSTWTLDQIEERQTELAAYAPLIWPL